MYSVGIDFAVDYRAFCDMRQTVLQNAAFCVATDGILHDKRRHFAVQNAVFCNSLILSLF